jgi:cytochrome c oxidase subunit 1
MSNEANLHGHTEIVTTHEVHHDEHHVHHHKETFITKYIFSQDHKTIGKQFLITGIAWAIIGGLFSVLFRLQLGFPDQTFPILETFFGRYAKGGQIQPEFYYALITMHGTVLVFFVLTAGLSGTFANLLIPLQCGARDMASPFLNMLSYWFFFMASMVMISSLFVSTGPASGGWTMYPPLRPWVLQTRIKTRTDLWLSRWPCLSFRHCWVLELYFHYSQHAYKV